MEDGAAASGMDRKRKHGCPSPDTDLHLCTVSTRPASPRAPSPPPPPPSSTSPSFTNNFQPQNPPDYQITFPSEPRQQDPWKCVPPLAANDQTPSTTLRLGNSSKDSTASVAQSQDPVPPPTDGFSNLDPSPTNVVVQQAHPPGRRTVRTRRNMNQPLRRGKDIHVPPPFQWATNLRAIVHSLKDLNSLGISTIKGEVQCKRCDALYEMGFDLMTQFHEISEYIRKNKLGMHDRAPKEWMTPSLPDCRECKQTDCMKPVISPKKRSINWLFLLLGKMLGCCTINQLKYFCKHTKNHRTGAKDRVLYLTYLGLCNQLHPNVLFQREC